MTPLDTATNRQIDTDLPATPLRDASPRRGKPKSAEHLRVVSGKRKIVIDRSRDALLTDFGKKTLEDRYLLPEESDQDMFARVASAYADDDAHAQRLYDYISRLWFMPATPVLSNGGAGMNQRREM